ncbi:MAG: hypothetical protein ACOC5T_06020 [Elusimicrobiota bacterium]
MSKQCSICGKDLSRMNLDFSKKIICSSCLLKPKRIPHKRKKEEEEKERYETDVYFVKKLYEAVKSGEIVSVDAIDCLERTIRKNFKNKRDFYKKMEEFLKKHDYRGVDLRRARKRLGMDPKRAGKRFEMDCQKRDRRILAWWLDVSIHRIKQMEANKKPLTRKAIDFIRIMGFKKTVTMKKHIKKANKGYSTRTPKKTKTSPKKKTKKHQILAPLNEYFEEERDFHESEEKRDRKAQGV